MSSSDRPMPPENVEVREGEMPRRIRHTEQALRTAGFQEPILPPAAPIQPEHVHDLCLKAAANADKHGVHGTQPATVAPPSRPSDHSVLLGCLVILAFCTPWFVGTGTIVNWIWSKLP